MSDSSGRADLSAIVCAALLLCALPVWAETEELTQQIERVEVRALRDPAMMPYKDAYNMLSKFQSTDKYDRLDLKVKVVSKDKTIKPSAIALRLVGDTLDVPIAVAADGRVQVPLLPEALLDNAEIVSNQPKKSLQAHAEFVMRLPVAQRYSYREVMGVLPQADQALREFVPWYLRWLAPSFSAVEFRFAEGVRATAAVRLDDRVEQFVADERGHVKIRFHKDWLALNPDITLSAAPLEAAPTVWAEPRNTSDDVPVS